jgi:hypothetical protein
LRALTGRARKNYAAYTLLKARQDLSVANAQVQLQTLRHCPRTHAPKRAKKLSGKDWTLRTAFDRASELLGVDPAKKFAEKLTDLVSCGNIGSSEKDTLDTLTDAAGAAAHRGWKPNPKELNTMMDIIEAFLYRTFILADAAKSLQRKRRVAPKTAAKCAQGHDLKADQA